MQTGPPTSVTSPVGVSWPVSLSTRKWTIVSLFWFAA